MIRSGRCSVCGLLVALHFTEDNRKLTCRQVTLLHGLSREQAERNSFLVRQLRSLLHRKPQELKHASCGTPMTRTREGRYECPACKVAVIVGRAGDHNKAFEGDRNRSVPLPILSQYDGDFND